MTDGLLFDTNVVIDLIDERPYAQQVVNSARKVFVTATTLGELYYGCERAASAPKCLMQIDRFLANSILLVVDAVTAKNFGIVKHVLRRKGKPIPDNDAWIAAAAIQHGLRLVTRDAHFREVPGLDLLSL
jgi:tRNA(fMet)-specific endonuclease VapC